MKKPNEIRCPECDCLLKQKDLKKGICWKCSISITELKNKIEKEKINSEIQQRVDKSKQIHKSSNGSSNSRYYALRIVSGLLIFIGWGCFIVALFWFFYLLSQIVNYDLSYAGLLQPIGLIIGGVINIALAQLINLFIDIANDVNKIKKQKV